MSTTTDRSTQVIVERVRSRINDLRNASTTATWQYVRGDDGQVVRRAALVEHPPLLAQLARSAAKSTGGLSSGAPGSRPPGSLDGTDTLRTITREAAYLAGRVLATLAAAALPGLAISVRPRTVGDSLAVLHQYAPQLDAASLDDVDVTVRSWWVHARIATTWERPPLRPWVPCPACRQRGGLRVLDEPLVMLCRECGETWDHATVGELATIYELAFASSIDVSSGVSLQDGAPSA